MYPVMIFSDFWILQNDNTNGLPQCESSPKTAASVLLPLWLAKL